MGTTTVNISAAQVKDLREKTGAPMMDCKQALTEAKGDMEQAVVILRKKGVSVAPGSAFGEVGKDAVRISLASSDQDLREGVSRLAEFVRTRS